MRLTKEKAAEWLAKQWPTDETGEPTGGRWVGMTSVRRYAGTDKPQRKRITDNMRKTGDYADNPYEFGIATIASRALLMGTDFGTMVENRLGRVATENMGITLEAIDAYDTSPIWGGKGRHDTFWTVIHEGTGRRSYKGWPIQDRQDGEVKPVKRRWYVMNADDTLGDELTGDVLAKATTYLSPKALPSVKQAAYFADQLAPDAPPRVADVVGESVPGVAWRYVRLDHVLELRFAGGLVTVTDNMREAWGKALTFNPNRDGTLVVA